MANLDFYSFFDYNSAAGDTYEYTSSEFSRVLKDMVGTGIVNSIGAKFATTANGLVISVGAGACFIIGRYGASNGVKTVTLDATATGTTRVDRIVLRMDTSAQTISIEPKQGTATEPPALTQTDAIYEIPICKCLVNGSSVTLTDERALLYTPTEAMEEMIAITNGDEYVYAVYA